MDLISFISSLFESPKVSYGNDGAIAAAKVMARIFETTYSGTINIYAKSMNGEISCHADYLKQLRDCIVLSNVRIRVLIDSIPENIESGDETAYTMLKRFSKDKRYQGRISIETITESGKINVKEQILSIIDEHDQLRNHISSLKGDFHFASTSLGAYRLETDNKKHIARYNFKDIQIAKKLNNIFDSIFPNALLLDNLSTPANV